MKNNYVVDKVPYDKLGVQSQKDYGKVWYCHMRDFPNIPVGGSIGTKRHAQKMCDLYNLKFKGNTYAHLGYEKEHVEGFDEDTEEESAADESPVEKKKNFDLEDILG